MGLASGSPAAVARAGAVSLDCFGTLVDADRAGDPWDAVAAALADRGIRVPVDWEAAYRTSHRDLERLEDQPLGDHVRAALRSRGVDCDPDTASEAVFAAFDVPVTARPGAAPLLEALQDREVPVAVVSNCSVPGLVERALERAGLADGVALVVTSVDCGRLKPHRRPFETAADGLGVAPSDLVHVGDAAGADGAAASAGATAVIIGEDCSLADIVGAVEGSACR